jgi:uncharacterized membrane protein
MIEIIPNWHPMLVHFTVALLALAVVLSWFTWLPLPGRLRSEWGLVARWLLWFGSAFAIATAVTGWLAYNSVDHDDLSHIAMTDHRNWALVTLGLFLLLAGWSSWERFRDREPGAGKVGIVFLALLTIGGGLLASTAWRGAELVFRHGLGVMSLPNTGVKAVNRDQSGNSTPLAHDHSTHTH